MDKVSEGVITEEQWKKMAKWFFAGESILFHLIEEEQARGEHAPK